MAGQRLSMRKTREILRQKWCLGRSHREVARCLGKSLGAINAMLARATTAELDWEAVSALSDEALDGRLYCVAVGGGPWSATLRAVVKRPAWDQPAPAWLGPKDRVDFTFSEAEVKLP